MISRNKFTAKELADHVATYMARNRWSRTYAIEYTASELRVSKASVVDACEIFGVVS